MFSVIKDSRIKDKCQIFTPKEQVSKMLDLALYTKDLHGKRFLENSCGDGEILIQAVVRYIEDCKKKRFSKKKIKLGLETDFIAYEVDNKRIEECKIRLDKVTKQYKITDVVWNIRCEDYLASKCEMTYDFIVGNPPYIAYPDLPIDVQTYVKENFVSCKKGKFDYSYAFIEKSYSELSEKGSLVYIIPSNIFKNVFADELRNIIKNDIYSIDDFPSEKIFGKVLVSPAIISIIKGNNSSKLLYRVAGVEKSIDKTQLKSKWIFDNVNVSTGKRVGDFFKVSSSVATLLNEAFILKNGGIKDGFYEFANHKVEITLIRKAASPKNKKYNKSTEYIIFPYFYDDQGKLQHYSEEEMYASFPNAMTFLETYKEKLQKRDADSTAKWFEYGRSQALQNINQKLVLISSVISDCTEPYMIEVDEVPYSGLYIMPISNMSLDSLISVLKSTKFKEYIKSTGVCVSGTSKRISPKDIENYIF